MAEEVLDQTQAQPGVVESATTTEGTTPAEGKDESKPGWLNSVPRDYREKVGGYDSMSAFMADALDAIDAKGRAVVRPKEDAAPEQWAEYWKSVGRPESAEGYTLQAPDGVSIDNELAKEFRQIAFDRGLTDEQANKLFGWYVETVVHNQAKRIEQGSKEAESELRNSWGADYDGNIQVVKRFMEQNTDPEFAQFLNESELGNDARLIRFVHRVASKMSQDRGVFGGASRQTASDQEKYAALYPSHKQKGWA